MEVDDGADQTRKPGGRHEFWESVTPAVLSMQLIQIHLAELTEFTCYDHYQKIANHPFSIFFFLKLPENDAQYQLQGEKRQLPTICESVLVRPADLV